MRLVIGKNPWAPLSDLRSVLLSFLCNSTFIPVKTKFQLLLLCVIVPGVQYTNIRHCGVANQRQQSGTPGNFMYISVGSAFQPTLNVVYGLPDRQPVKPASFDFILPWYLYLPVMLSSGSNLEPLRTLFKYELLFTNGLNSDDAGVTSTQSGNTWT